MSSLVTYKLDSKNFNLAARRLGAKAHVAIVRSLKRSSVTVRTFMQRTIAPLMGIAAKAVQKAIYIYEGKVESAHSIAIGAKGAGIPLIYFKARGPEPSLGRGTGVTAKLPGQGTVRLPHGFIATMPSGRRGVFERKGRKRLPIKEQRGPSIADVFASYEGAAKSVGETALQKNLSHEFKWAMKEAAQGS